MKRFPVVAAALTCVALSAFARPAFAAFEYFLDIPGIPGESVNERRKDTIEVSSFSWGVSNPATIGGGSGGASGGKAVFDEFKWTQLVDKSVPLSFLAVASGRRLDQVVLSIDRVGEEQRPFFAMSFSDAILTSLRLNGREGNDPPTAALSLAAAKVKLSYFPTKPDGSAGPPIVGEWDLNSKAANAFSGDPNVLFGLFEVASFSATSEGFSFDTAEVPEPSTYALLLAGLAMLGFMTRRRVRGGHA